MLGIQIFIHSVRQVFGNFGAALRISGLLMLVQFAMGYVIGMQSIYEPNIGQSITPVGLFQLAPFFFYWLIVIFLDLWIAVAWHRYLLRDEISDAVLPMWHGDRIWAYFVMSLVIGFAAFVTFYIASFVIGFVVQILLGALGSSASFVTLTFATIVSAVTVIWPPVYVLYRLSPALPAAALGETLMPIDAWEEMDGTGGTVFVLAVISVLASLLLAVGPNYLLGLNGIASQLWDLVCQWINLLVGISIITTLYGHYLEDRPLV